MMAPVSVRPAQSFHLGVRQRAMLGVRRAAKSLGRLLNAYVDYDVRMYEAIRDLRPWSPDDVVLDVGANDGRTVWRLMRHLPAPRILALEPASPTFETLCEATHQLDNVQRFRLALGSEPGRCTMYLNELGVLNSLDPSWGPMHGKTAAPHPTEQVDVTTLDHFVSSQGLQQVGLLKIDTEGHDLKVLQGAQETLRRGSIDIVQVEAGFDAPGRRQPSLTEIQEYLRGYGYYLYGIYNQCRNAAPGLPRRAPGAAGTPDILLFCDALFVHSPTSG